MLWGECFCSAAISYGSARRTLARIERITESRAHWREDLEARARTCDSDEISRLAKTFNHMLGRLQASVNQLRTLTAPSRDQEPGDRFAGLLNRYAMMEMITVTHWSN
jgi:methyl-accepting chemotaxis protein